VRSRRNATDLSQLAGIVLIYQGALMRRLLSAERSHQLAGWVSGDLHLLEQTQRRVGFCGGFGVGAPATALVMEQLIALGVPKILLVGTAGALQEGMEAGDVVLCDRAIRDEGLSHHYSAPSKYAFPSRDLVDRLGDGLHRAQIPHRCGTSWTTDAPYRETVVEAELYRDQGVLTVEMEAAAAFTVADHRQTEAAAVLAVSDVLVNRDRESRRETHKTQITLDSLFRVAVAALM
jgi:uridine phosphorylase